MPTVETHAFQAETKELLDLVVHSLYTHEEIFLRELLSNASDALDKLRVEGLRDRSLAVDLEGLSIRIVTDPEARTLSVVDNGIGMSRAEVLENIGTIARSGTKAFSRALKEVKAAAGALPDFPDFIGQFGVGFYSSFMVADEVVLETRRAGEAKGVRWRSRGDGEYTLEDLEGAELGTRVTLHLKAKDPEDAAARDYTEGRVLRDLVRRYSDFLAYPITLEEGGKKSGEVLNSRKPLWTRSREEVKREEYVEFYRHLTHDWREPLETIHFKAEGASEYAALLYLPKERPFDLFDPAQPRSRVSLYVRRVFIMADCEELAPSWLRFVRGVVDSADLPLNVSRETLQANRQTAQIQKRLVRKVLETLGELLAERRAEYVEFWKHFGPVLKEGLWSDDAHREELARVALFASSAGEDLTNFSEYVARMPVAQTEIYALLAPDLEAARRSPHLEALRARDFEVLLFGDPVDEFVLQRLSEFEGRKIRRVERGDVDLGESGAPEERERLDKETAFAALLEAVRKSLAGKVEDVRFSKRLTESPACLVAGEHDLSPQMRRMMRDLGQSPPPERRALELNARHPLVEQLHALSTRPEDVARFDETCEVLLGLAQVSAGEAPSDPARFARLVAQVLGR
jgi:molecular chaperone HtpG